jgi:hypothetical protein
MATQSSFENLKSMHADADLSTTTERLSLYTDRDLVNW